MKESKIDKIITDTPLWVVTVLYFITGVLFFGSIGVFIFYIVHYAKTP